jgi:serine/threonine protein kinase
MAGPPAPDPLAGRSLRDFVLHEKLGEGGFGAVYRAEQPRLGREAVVKILRARLGGSARERARFVLEARLASRFDHPFAAHVYDSDVEADGTLWIAMELVRGLSLQDWLRERGPFQPAAFAPLFERIGEVVQTAHDQGIVHRDLKPANVMVMERGGQLLPKLLDFGIAKIEQAAEVASAAAEPEATGPVLLIEPVGQLQQPPRGEQAQPLPAEPDARAPAEHSGAPEGPALIAPIGSLSGPLTADGAESITPGQLQTTAALDLSRTGRVLGSPSYMAPEQWLDAAQVDHRTDLYALGVLCYEALAGRRPFEGESIESIAQAHLAAVPAPLGAGHPAALDAFFAKALAKRKEARFGSATEMAQAFSVAAGAARRGPGSHLRGRLRLLIGVVALVAVALGAREWRRGSLPVRGRVLWLSVAAAAKPDEAWMGTALQRMAARKLRQASRRYQIADDEADANLAAGVRWRLEKDEVVLEADLGRSVDGRAVRLPEVRARSAAEALDQLIGRLGERLDANQPEREPDARERNEMSLLGARSLRAFQAYSRAVSTYYGANYSDNGLAERQVREAIAADPAWAHPHALLFVLQGGGASEATRDTLKTARHLADAARDPAGVAILEAWAALIGEGPLRTASRLQPWLQGRMADVALQAAYLDALHSVRRTEDAVSLGRALTNARPELQFGSWLAGYLAEAQQPAEAARTLRDWVARAPDSEQALLSLAGLALDEGRNEEVSSLLERVLRIHGDAPVRLPPIISMQLSIGRIAEARRLAEGLLLGNDFDRARGLLRLAFADILQGRFIPAYKGLQAGLALARTQGSEGESVQFLDSLRALAPLVGGPQDPLALAEDQTRIFSDLGWKMMAAVARLESALLAPGRRECPSVERSLEAFSEVDRISLRPLLLRVSAAQGCSPCKEPLRLGLSGEEVSTRLLYLFAACGESEGQVALARQAFARVGHLTLERMAYPSPYHSVMANFHLGRIAEAAGDQAAARAAYQDFLGYWGEADHPIAEVEAARSALHRLGSQAR